MTVFSAEESEFVTDGHMNFKLGDFISRHCSACQCFKVIRSHTLETEIWP